MLIELERRQPYGQSRIYFKDEKLGLAFCLLTGRKTLSVEDKHALETLGCEFREVMGGN